MPYSELTADQGATFETSLDLVNDDGSAINVTNYVFSGSIRKSYYSANAVANLTIQVDSASNGNLTILMNAATTTNIKAGRYLYDVKMIDTANTVTRVVEGIITITPQVTK